MRKLQELLLRDKYDDGGYCEKEKRNIIHDYVLKRKKPLCVEIGVFKGSTLLSFAEALEVVNGVIVGIDPMNIHDFKNEISDKKIEKYIYEKLFTKQKTLDDIFENLLSIIKNNDLSKTIKIFRKKSEDTFNIFKKESIDIIHIDGNHNEESVSKDIENYFPLIKQGGIIMMDDSDWKGVRNSINKLLIGKTELQVSNKHLEIYTKK